MIEADVCNSEINDDLTPTSEFYIGRYLVTVGQFKVFVNATGFSFHENKALQDSFSNQPASWEEALRVADNRPISWVSWYEALAYCDWLVPRCVASERCLTSHPPPGRSGRRPRLARGSRL